MFFNKLVRDKIPEIIRTRGKKMTSHIANNDEYWTKLLDKLQEEIDEYRSDESEEELADVLEVIDTIIDHKGYNRMHLEDLRKAKLQEKGGFKDRIILDEVSD